MGTHDRAMPTKCRAMRTPWALWKMGSLKIGMLKQFEVSCLGIA